MLKANSRYMLHWYPFAAACLALGLLLLTGKHRRTRRYLVPAAAIVFSLSAFRTIARDWRVNDGSWLESNLGALRQAAHLSGKQNMYIDDRRFFYYLDTASYPPTHRLTKPQDAEKMCESLERDGVGVVALAKIHADFWPQTALSAAMTAGSCGYFFKETDSFLIYVTGQEAVERRKLEYASALKTAKKKASFHLAPNTGIQAGLPANCRPTTLSSSTRLLLPDKTLDPQEGAFATWAKMSDASGPYHTLLRVNAANTVYAYHTGVHGGMVFVYDGKNIGSSNAVDPTMWHHYALSWKDGEQAMYVDGLPVLRGTLPAAKAVMKTSAVGWLGNGAGETWTGELCAATAYKKSLTPQEVAALYIWKEYPPTVRRHD